MKEGKLSSALMEKHKISEKDSVGKVLWHSLNENGQIDMYNMKFGQTIVKNILAEDIDPVMEQDHSHPVQKRDVD